jgi:glycosyltransferase involved in cell wall biosynthesis
MLSHLRHSVSTGNGLNAPSVTVVLPNYNHARFLRESLGSFLGQTRPPDELIVVDDASTDNSVDVILDVIDGVPGAKLLRNPKNVGAVASMNRGLEIATGDLVLFAAADDVYYPRLLEVGTAMLAAYPQAALFSALSDIISPDGVNKGRFLSPTPSTAPGYLDPRSALREMLRDDGWFMGDTVLYRRSALLAEGSFDGKLGSFVDGYMCRLLALKHGACFSPEILAGWRRLEGGIAWSQAVNTDRAADFVALVEARMAETGGLFPAQYIYRWQRRYLFAGYRMALAHRHSARSGISKCLGRMFDAVRLSWKFLTLRPWDIGTVSQRWMRELWDRRVSASKVNSPK